MSIQESFDAFHEDNPHVYEMFDEYARELLAAGYRKLSSKLIFERMRWESLFVTTDRQFKLRNDFTAYYSRLWMKKNNMPGVFKTKQLTAQ